MKKAALIFIILIFTGCATVEMNESERYQNEVDKIKKRLPDADFTNLRMIYTNTAEYQPFGSTEGNMLDPMFEALQNGEYKRCLKGAESILDTNYASLNAHYAAMSCHYESGNAEEGAFHRYVLDGLVDSIDSSGDGRSRRTAYVVISLLELRAFLDLKGLVMGKRNQIKSRNRVYNVVKVTDQQSGERYEVNFDITLQMAKGI